MFSVKSLISISVVAMLIACTTTPKVQVQPFGVYGQIFFQEDALMEMEHASAAKCAEMVNQDIERMDEQGRKQISNGLMRLTCSEKSLSDKLPFIGETVNILTNTKYKLRFATEGACNYLTDTMKKQTPTYTYTCIKQ